MVLEGKGLGGQCLEVEPRGDASWAVEEGAYLGVLVGADVVGVHGAEDPVAVQEEDPEAGLEDGQVEALEVTSVVGDHGGLGVLRMGVHLEVALVASLLGDLVV